MPFSVNILGELLELFLLSIFWISDYKHKMTEQKHGKAFWEIPKHLCLNKSKKPFLMVLAQTSHIYQKRKYISDTFFQEYIFALEEYIYALYK